MLKTSAKVYLSALHLIIILWFWPFIERKAADDMEDPIAIMLKYLNVMGNISTKNNKTLVVPIPKVCHGGFHILPNPSNM